MPARGLCRACREGAGHGGERAEGVGIILAAGPFLCLRLTGGGRDGTGYQRGQQGAGSGATGGVRAAGSGAGPGARPYAADNGWRAAANGALEPVDGGARPGPAGPVPGCGARFHGGTPGGGTAAGAVAEEPGRGPGGAGRRRAAAGGSAGRATGPLRPGRIYLHPVLQLNNRAAATGGLTSSAAGENCATGRAAASLIRASGGPSGSAAGRLWGFCGDLGLDERRLHHRGRLSSCLLAGRGLATLS